ncbi:PAS domain S-box protein [Phormidesmis priestleyi]
MISTFWDIPGIQSRKSLEFLERSLNPICVCDDRGHTIYASQSFLKLLKSHTSDNFFDYFPADVRADLTQFWQRAIRGERSQFLSTIRDAEEPIECSLQFDSETKLMFLEAKKMDAAERIRSLTVAYERAISRSAHTNLATALINPNGDIIQCNQKLQNLLGTSDRGLNLEQFVHPDDRFVDDSLKQNLLNRTINTYTIEKRFISRNQEVIWLNVNVSTIELSTCITGHQNYYAVLLEDVTESKKIYSTLVRTEEKWKTLFLDSPYLFIQASKSGQMTYVSPAVEDMLGYQPEELLGRQIKELIHPSNLNEFELALQLWGSNLRSHQSIECWWRAKSNRWVALSIQGQQFPSVLEIEDIVISGHNITDRKCLEVELRASEEKFGSLVLNSLGAVFRCDSSYTMEFVSDGVLDITGYPASVFANNQVRSYLSIVYPDDIALLKDSLIQTILDRHRSSIDYRIVNADGSIRWVTERKQGVFDQNGNLLWLDGVLLDISDRKQVEAELLHCEAAT